MSSTPISLLESGSCPIDAFILFTSLQWYKCMHLENNYLISKEYIVKSITSQIIESISALLNHPG